MRIGSLFSGVGMLDVAAMEMFPGSAVAWHCEVGTGASRVLARHWPDVPNLGDVSELDWADVPSVDIITGGFPCQDVPAAGLRAGLGHGTRSGLWSHMRDAIDEIRPRWVLIENVKGLLSARALRRMESDQDAMGNEASRPVLRAIGAVLGDLADIGFDAEWSCVRASGVGACHRRERVFILAYPADASGSGRESVDGRASSPAPCHSGERVPHGGARSTPDAVVLLPTPMTPDACGAKSDLDRRNCPQLRAIGQMLPRPSVADGEGEHTSRSGARIGELLLGGIAKAYAEGALLPTPRATDGSKGGPNQRGSSGDLMLPSAVQRLLPTPNASDCTGGGAHPDAREGHSRQLIDYALLHNSPQWGQYEAAIRQQEALSRPAPTPTEPNSRGNQRLSVRFAEWLMFWPDGWVTDPVLGLSRIDQLRCIGNGVVPPQAVAAFRHLFEVSAGAA